MEGKQLKKPVFIHCGQLEPGTRVNMHLKVHSIKIVKEIKRYDGQIVKFAECLVGDPHGCVIFWAKNEQLDNIKEGGEITVRNAHANVVQEHLRLEVDRWGKVETSNVHIDTVKTANNLSDVEYELVQVKK